MEKCIWRLTLKNSCFLNAYCFALSKIVCYECRQYKAQNHIYIVTLRWDRGQIITFRMFVCLLNIKHNIYGIIYTHKQISKSVKFGVLVQVAFGGDVCIVIFRGGAIYGQARESGRGIQGEGNPQHGAQGGKTLNP